jgi:hypothetical protein
MVEDKKDKIGGTPGVYWRYIAVLAIASVLIYVWNTFFVTQPPEQYTINYSQFMEQLDAGNHCCPRQTEIIDCPLSNRSFGRV